MLEKEKTLNKEEREQLKREIIAEIKEKKGGARRTAGLVMSGVGGLIYLFTGMFNFLISYSYYSFIGVSLMIAGGLAVIGTIVGLNKIKAGGGVILGAIPLALVIVIIFGFMGLFQYYYSYSIFYTILNLLLPLPFPHSIHVIIGGILCLTASDKRLDEY